MNFSDIKGKTIATIEGTEIGSERIVFSFDDGTAIEVMHMQDCCESVGVNRIEGHLPNIVGQTILEADESFDSEGDMPEHADSWTWTRQRIKTSAGEVTFVWLGESNGYYGETPYTRITHGKLV